MKFIQIKSFSFYDCILRSAGVKRIYPGWYSVYYNGVDCSISTVVKATRNPKGLIRDAKLYIIG